MVASYSGHPSHLFFTPMLFFSTAVKKICEERPGYEASLSLFKQGTSFNLFKSKI